LNKSDRIVVTGAASLAGSALVDHLRAEGYGNVVPLQRADCDLIDTPATLALFERRRPDQVFHAAHACGIIGTDQERLRREEKVQGWGDASDAAPC
jgi:GDP-L-fucose synthase